MPSNYYWADNFFQKMTDLDSPRRNNDCYFYYYSTCAKGDSCTFRHEPSALGCETMCSFWKEGKCLNVHCNFRHMELRKNRKAIQCYWETQPGGCLKPHCPFLHQNVKQSLNDYADNNIGPTTETPQTGKQNDIGQTTEKFKTPVESLVVSFEEESDTESAPSFSPVKNQIRKVNVKTLEEIKLERIQEEAAAYFAYNENQPATMMESEDDLRHRLLVRMKNKRQHQDAPIHGVPAKKKRIDFIENDSLDDVVTVMMEEGKRSIPCRSAEEISLDEHIRKRKQKFLPLQKKDSTALSGIKIKTLAEIRAERLNKQENIEPDSPCNERNLKRKLCLNDSEDQVTSTSKDEADIRTNDKEQPKKRLRLKRLSSTELNHGTSDVTADTDHKTDKNELALREGNCSTDEEFRSPRKSDSETTVNTNTESESKESHLENEGDISVSNESKTEAVSTKEKLHEEDRDSKLNPKTTDQKTETPYTSLSSPDETFPLTEEALLLDCDEDLESVTLKSEDELLDEIDELLGS